MSKKGWTWVARPFVLLLFLAIAASGATITPSDRVQSYVSVREQPSSDSDVVGKLEVGHSAALLESIPRWLKVRLADGTEGFVSKAWTRVDQEEATGGAPGVPATGGATPAVASANASPSAPLPLLETGHPVDWWFVFKFNTKSFPDCGNGATRQCSFGGEVQSYPSGFGQQFVYASSESPTLQKGAGCVGEMSTDPLGATFGELYNGTFHYVVWNDQFYDDPAIAGCTK
jgi:hypothetical protein